MGLYVSFPVPGPARGLVFSAAGGVDAFTASVLPTPVHGGAWIVSSVFSGFGFLSSSPSLMLFAATWLFTPLSHFTLGFSLLLTQLPSFGWINLNIPWLVLLSSIICRLKKDTDSSILTSLINFQLSHLYRKFRDHECSSMITQVLF